MLQKLYESRTKANEESGFTLIELLIVIVVLAILAAIVIFGLSGVTSQSAASSCKSDAKSTEVAVEAYKAETGSFPNDPALLTATSPQGVRYLRTFAGAAPAPNASHYVLTLQLNAGNGTGVVLVQPNDGAGAAAKDANGNVIAPTDFDNTTGLTHAAGGGGAGSGSANPCDYVK